MGLGFSGQPGFGVGHGRPLMITSGSGLGSRLGLGAGFLSGWRRLGFGFARQLGSAGSGFLPRISAVVAAATSRAGMTSPSSAGAGSLTGSAGPASWPARLFGCGTLRSRTVGLGTGFRSGPRPERSTSSCSFFACFCRSRARRSSASSLSALALGGDARGPRASGSTRPVGNWSGTAG